MKKLLLFATLVIFLTGCGSGPTDKDIKGALENKMRSELQQQIETMIGILGKTPQDVAKSIGLPDPKDIYIDALKSEELKKIDNGDYVAKVTFTTHIRDKKEEKESSVRVTMTEVQGKWKILNLEDL